MRAINLAFVVRLTTLAVVAAVLTTGTADSRVEAADRPTTKTTGKLQIHVVDAAGMPLANAQVHASIWTQEKDFKHNRYYTADKDGLATVELPATLEIVRIWAKQKSYAPMFAQLWPQGPADTHPLPEEFKFELVNGTSMGGSVVDDAGKPLKGVRVEVEYESGGVPGRTLEPGTYDDSLAYGVAGRITDSDGRWSIDNVPPGDEVEVRLKLSHRDYVSDTGWGGLQKEQVVNARQLRDASAKIVMRRGHAVAGTVTAPDGQPIVNALVVEGENRQWQDGRGETRTDKEGKFRLGALPVGQVRINVLAEGYMPESRRVDNAAEQPVDFQLRPGKKLRLKFVDEQGQPIPQVAVYPGQWRGMEQIGGRSQSKVNIPRLGDSHGIYEWSWAPDDAVTYTMRTDGFANTEVTIAADDEEHVVMLMPVLQLAGTVRDATTGQSIADVRAIPVIFFRPDFPLLNRREAARTDDGTFRLEFERTDIEHGVQIEAPGYFTFRTDGRFKVGEPNQQLDVRLQPASRYAGRVLDAQRRPVEAAKVYVATGFQHCDVFNLVDRYEDSTHNYHVTSDQAGDFEIVAQSDDYTLIVVAPQGYASVERLASELPGELQIDAWACVRGRVVQNGQPMPNHTVYCLPIRFRGGGAHWIDFRQTTKTAEDGSFAFDQVPPSAVYVRPDLHFSVESKLKSSQSVPLDLKPGEDVSLELGGNGAEVSGQLVLDKPRDDFDFHFSLTYLVARKPGIAPPKVIAGKGFDWQKGWSDSWRNTQEGGAYLQTLYTWFVKPDADGKIHISGVPSGEYQLAAALYGSTEGCLVHPVATRVVNVIVPSDQATVELGNLVIPTNGIPQLGDAAANFAITTPRGETTDLSTHRGKYVLIDFWATWCGPCIAKLPETEALRKQSAEGGRLVVVGANLDPEAAAAEKYLQEHPLPWHHALLGDWSNTDVPQQYGISSIPAYVLVDPEGKILAMEYSLDTLTPKLEAAMSRTPAK